MPVVRGRCGVKKCRIGVAWLAAVGLVMALTACGDDESNTTPTTIPTTTTTTTPPPTSITLIRGTELIPKPQLFIRDLVVEEPGRLDITVEYTHQENWILFWLTDRKCSRQMFDNDACSYLTKSIEGSSPRTGTVPSVEPGTYTFFIANDGPLDDYVTYSIELTPSN
jgi:hypothetical protein